MEKVTSRAFFSLDGRSFRSSSALLAVLLAESLARLIALHCGRFGFGTAV